MILRGKHNITKIIILRTLSRKLTVDLSDNSFITYHIDLDLDLCGLIWVLFGLTFVLNSHENVDAASWSQIKHKGSFIYSFISIEMLNGNYMNRLLETLNLNH